MRPVTHALQLLIGGVSVIDVEDMRQHCELHPARDAELARIMGWFWAELHGFTAEDRARLLQFVTGSASLPVGGCALLRPRLQFSLDARDDGLPTAHTCFNQLCLPRYRDQGRLHAALRTAIEDGCEGFELR